VYIPTTPSTGTLIIVAPGNATIKVEPLRKDGTVVSSQTKQVKIEPEQGWGMFEKLTPGRYRIVGELDGHLPDQKVEVVKRGTPGTVILNLTPKTYNVTLSFNIASGRVIYGRGTEPARNTVEFQNNRTTLPDLRPGSYEIRVEPDDVSYPPITQTVEVASNVNLPITLGRKETTDDFFWQSAGDWSLPSGWRVISGPKLVANGSGIALPSDTSFHYYKDFQLSTNVKMINGVAASFAVRVRDSQNYYLVQLTGANADEPYMLRGFVVRNGVAQRLPRAYAVKQYANVIKQGKFIQTSLIMKGSTIEVSITDTENGEAIDIGVIPDPAETFAIGAVGVAVRDKEQTEIETFNVCVSCRKR